jgi:hypothetical protein
LDFIVTNLLSPKVIQQSLLRIGIGIGVGIGIGLSVVFLGMIPK